ncbi:hypothetical protein EVAR_80659_1 [Eumeta japonica]|uniref:Uncharacterized protein n=1 Tax=Eumeta variegata TaxID=151549 RepID=A0A4C1U3E1_EUMVA|nr:hypothetical protein EVAR_80659_1 [Eumeta japonica]
MKTLGTLQPRLVHVTQRFLDFVVQGVANVRHSTLVGVPESFSDFIQQGVVNVQGADLASEPRGYLTHRSKLPARMRTPALVTLTSQRAVQQKS